MNGETRKYLERGGVLLAVALLGGGTGTLAGGSTAADKVENLEQKVHQIELTQRDILGEVKALRDNQIELEEDVERDRVVRDAKLQEILDAVQK